MTGGNNMKLRRKILPLLLVFVLAVSPLWPTMARASDEERRMVVTFEEGADSDLLLSQLSALTDVTVLYRYDLLLRGAAVEADADATAAIRSLPGVSNLIPTRDYSQPQAISDPLVSSNSLNLMLGEDLDYTGDGMVIAVLDSGLRYTHEAFGTNGLTASPAISREDVYFFAAGSGIPGRYISERIPFAFDYAGGDAEVFTTDTHGTHVSALAVGYAKDPDGAVTFRGAAPAAQLLSMKVFGDSADSGANDADVLKALEDSVALGADVICLSLGTDNGFVEDDSLDGLYSQIFSQLRSQGTVICCAAGNAASAVSAKAEGIALPTADYTDYGTIAAPASYEGTVAVAAAQATIWQSTGYIQAGERQLSFTRAVSEAGIPLPVLDDLAGQTLPLVPVGGAGRASDYAGLDMRGKIALVQRGEITFTEKVQNAADAGAAACLVYNNETGDITPIVECTSIPCGLISQEDGAWLLGSRETSIAISSGACVEHSADGPAMLSNSAWGTTSDLSITPTLTAPGGTILSASAAGDSLYEQLSGTSMAAPNAAGAYALVLEKLYAEGMEDNAQAADLAEALLCSTARVMTTEEGVPLSPRRQGAGLIDLSAALNADAVISDPLLELGESQSGSFTLSFQVQNLTDEPMELTVDPTVLTDAWETDSGQAYSLLGPMDITDRVTVSGPEKITLPAGAERSVRLTVTVSASLKQELKSIYTNGFFTEGYITLTAENSSIHATFLGYCGDWEKAPVLEQTDFRDAMDAELTGTGLSETNMGTNLVHISGSTYTPTGSPLLGQNPYLSAPWRENRFAISTLDTDALYSGGGLFTTDLYTLRNAQRLIMVISDRSGSRIHQVTDIPYLSKSTLDEITGRLGSVCSLWWSGTDSAGNPLPDGSRVQVAFCTWPESDTAMTAAYESSKCDPADPASYRWLTSGSYDRCLEWSFPVTIDRSAPTVAVKADADTGSVVITVKDGQYLAYAAVKDSQGNILAEEAFADDRAGVSHTLTVEPSGQPYLYVTAVDYAGNTTAYAVDTAALTTAKCAMSLLKDVDMDAWYHDAVDYVWERGLMAEKEPLVFNPSDTATRADIITALYQLAGSPKVEQASLPFTDVHSGADYRDALCWAYENGLVTGYSETTFAAFANVSRQQLAVILHRWAQQTGETPASGIDTLKAFPDGSQVSLWAAQAMAWAVEEGILSGGADGTLAPERIATRAELAQIIMNYLEP